MRRWNGWGDDGTEVALSPAAESLLGALLGPGKVLADATLADVIAAVPASRLPPHALIVTAAEDRVRHARGQSLPDWLAMRSGDFGVFPDGVAYPESSEDVAEMIAYAASNDVVVIPYGGGTSVAGHITPLASEKPILTVDMGHMNRLLDLDTQSQIATFGAGTPGPQIESQLRARGYTLGHYPQSFELSTVGGWVASRSSGQQSLRYGRIEQMFAGGKLETPLGCLDLPTIPASSAGPDVREMVAGSEGRIGILSEVKVRVSRLPQEERFYAIFFPSWEQARNATRELVQQRIQLSMLRLSNAVETRTQLSLGGNARQLRWFEKYLALRGAGENKCMMMLGITGSRMQCRALRRQVRALLRDFGAVHAGTRLGDKWAHSRFTAPYLRESLWRKGYVVDTLETATDWDNVDNLLARIEHNLRTATAAQNERVHAYTHLSHMYTQGCSIYTTYMFRCTESYEKTLALWRTLKHTTSEIIVANGGTISHQHGVGKDHAPYLATEKGRLGMFALKNLVRGFDPDQRLNPGTLLSD